MPSAKPLPPKQARFVELFLVNLNATESYRGAYGASQKVAEANGPRLLGNARVAAAIAVAQQARAERTQITQDAVLTRLWTIATADPRALIEYRRTACRHCNGRNHDYQRTRGEMARDRRLWESTQKKNSPEVFDEAGGDGFNATKPPHPGCPECFGQGEERAFVHDTRTLSPAAAALYAGVKVTKEGIEVKMHDPLAALVHVGRHLGMFKEKEGGPLTDDERIARLRAGMRAMDDATIGAAAA